MMDNTDELRYVKLPENHIVVDFDIKTESNFPPTYAELNKSGTCMHLPYIYSGDPKETK